MILKESEIGDPDIIKPILGNPFKEPGKLLTATGSSYFFVKEITDTKGNPLPLKRENMKGIFQRYEKGLMLFLNGSNYQNAILIDFDSIKKITLIKGKESVSAWKSPILAFLVQRGFKFKYTKKFIPGLGLRMKETELFILTNNYRIRMATNGFSYSSQLKYFSKLKLGNKFEPVNSDKN
ncbi:MAG: hypothetical protein JJ971_11450 [Balneolaceae bacterium]|nr:hypothetical protein [Balneolaceae bacterium]MBO6546135.1 hypothetical protein [Balneolaceae bacterium]MBO6648493.1 hypothetical protein [Balneolaceae bacterium]